MDVIQYKILEAEEHNWGLIGPDDWKTQYWSVYNDGSFIYEKIYNSSYDDNKYSLNGFIDHGDFVRLTELFRSDWKISEYCSACDGTAWRIRCFYPSGQTRKSSGRTEQYIYGNDILEEIADILYHLV